MQLLRTRAFSNAHKRAVLNQGQVVPYVGGYDYFLDKTGGFEEARAALTAA
jgi:hypothetical protein